MKFLPGLMLLAATTAATAGPVRVTLRNGTTDGPGTADLLTLYRLGEGMEPIASLENPGAEAVLDGPDAGGAQPFLIQATWRGVNYNQPIRLGADGGGEAALTVFDTFSDWDDNAIALTTWRALYRRTGDRLRVDHILLVSNQTNPPRTFLDPDESFRMRVPPEGTRIGLPSLSATGGVGMPVPQSLAPVGEDAFAARTAFKPGETELVFSYEVDYAAERHEVNLVAPRNSPEALLLASPEDIALTLPDDAPDGWLILEPDPEAGLAAARKFGIVAGEPVRLVLSGGSVPAARNPAALPPVRDGEAGSGATGTIGLLPDPARRFHWILGMLMAAALAFGLLHRAFSRGP